MESSGRTDGTPLRADELAAWLEAVVAELDASAAGPVQAELVRTLARLMAEQPKLFLRAHAPVDREAVHSLVRRP